MKRFRKELVALSAGGTLCSNAFLTGLSGVDYSIVWTQFLALVFSVIASLLFGGDPSQFFQDLP